MAIQKIDVNEAKVTSKLIDLWLRPHAIYVTRMLDKNMHHLLVPFVVKKGEIVAAMPTKIMVLNDSVSFEGEVSGGVFFQGDNCISIQINPYNGKVGLMWPNYGRCYFADEMHPLDQRFSCCAKTNQDDDPTVVKLHLPYIDQTTPDSCLSVVSNKPLIEFNSFNHNFSPYLNVIADNSVSLAFRSFLSRRESLIDYQKRFGSKKRMQPAGIGFEMMKQALYHNSKIVPTTENLDILQQAREIQSTLDKHKISNCIIGSLAMQLHGVGITPNDVDFVVRPLSAAKDVFKDNVVSKSEKWSQCAIRLYRGEGQIDLVELCQFPWDQIEKIGEFNVLSMDGLLQMKLVGEVERNLIEPNYKMMSRNNQYSISTLLNTFPNFLYPFFKNFLLKHSLDNFCVLMDLLKEAEWDPVKISVNIPFVVNAYKKDGRTIIPVINSGSKQPARVLISRPLKNVQFYDIGESPVECEVSRGSIITPSIQSFGVIVCQDA